MPQLFAPLMGDKINARLAVTKSGEGQPLATFTYEHELLADSLTQTLMLPYWARIRAQSITQF